MTLREPALRMRCSRCGKKAAAAMAVAAPAEGGCRSNLIKPTRSTRIVDWVYRCSGEQGYLAQDTAQFVTFFAPGVVQPRPRVCLG